MNRRRPISKRITVRYPNRWQLLEIEKYVDSKSAGDKINEIEIIGWQILHRLAGNPFQNQVITVSLVKSLIRRLRCFV